MIADIVDKALALGASLAGIVQLDGAVRARIELPDAVDPARTFGWLLVLALAHGEDRPELDWWGGPGGTEGNRRLHEITNELKCTLAEEHGIHSHVLPYHPWKDGILLKNAAVLARLGVIGANNLLITPQYGPRVRLRAMLVEGTQEARFLCNLQLPKNRVCSPCDGCHRPCWQACPQDAFASGAYDRSRCARQMEQDEARAPTHPGQESGVSFIKYCRACELACPVGR